MQIPLSPEVLVNKRLYFGIGGSIEVPKLGMQNLSVWHEIAFTAAPVTHHDTGNSQISVHKAAPQEHYLDLGLSSSYSPFLMCFYIV